VPASKVEAVIIDALRRHIGHDAPVDNTELITTYVREIEVRRTEIAISLRAFHPRPRWLSEASR
jgi:hypothetical protein